MDNRTDDRLPFSIKAFPLDVSSGAILETRDVSSGGAFFQGTPPVPPGGSFWVRLELGTWHRGQERIFPLDAKVRVVREETPANSESTGFGAEWLRVCCREDIVPLKEFLRHILSISSGFVQTIDPEDPDEPRSYLYVFANGNDDEISVEVEEDTDPGSPASLPEDGEADEQNRLNVPARRETFRPGAPLYLRLPLTFSLAHREFEGAAIKMLQHSLRISTHSDLPEAYNRVTVRIPLKHGGKDAVLSLLGTVVTRRSPAREGEEGMFEVQLTLNNDPEHLAQYRKLLDQLSSASSPSGI